MQKQCSTCGSAFDISKDDLAFYERVSPVIAGQAFPIPPPTLCPACRYQRRLSFRNERTLYHRKCDLSGRAMISMHPADSPFPVYHITEWLSDKWDPKTYGRDFDFSRPFFEQFQELCNSVPHFSAFVDPQMDVNAEYTNCSSEAKNCYMISQAERNEDCYYSRGINNCRNCCDCYRVHKCELCYECIDANNCYTCIACQDCDNCSDCSFSSDLRACKNCFGCHGLVQKEYYIFNEPASKEEWAKKVQALTLTHDVINLMKKRSADARLKVPQRATRLIQCENVTGDHVTNSRNSFIVFDANDLEHCSYCNEIANGARYCHDYCMWGIECELLCECSGCGYNVYHCLFCNHCWQGVSNLLYCESCFPSVKDCFGCFGLRRSQYCILNKKYTKEEYEKLVPKIISHMRETKEYGEFFDPKISAYAYNETIAHQFFLLSKSDAQKRGWRWREDESDTENYLGPEVEIPESAEKITEDFCENILRCEVTHKPYRVIAQELQFLKSMHLPIPRKCPQQRHTERAQRRNPRKLWTRKCQKCQKQIQTTFAPERPEIVYCEQCYLHVVY